MKALYRSTLAGAEILGVGKTMGNFKKGKVPQFIVIQGKENCKNAEEALSQVILPLKDKREDYDHLVKEVYLSGKFYKTQPR